MGRGWRESGRSLAPGLAKVNKNRTDKFGALGPFIHCWAVLPSIRSVLGEIKWTVLVLRKLARRRGHSAAWVLKVPGPPSLLGSSARAPAELAAAGPLSVSYFSSKCRAFIARLGRPASPATLVLKVLKYFSVS